MKNLLSLVLLVFILVSCGKSSEESNYIPKDAIGVMYVNVKSLSEKTKDVDFSALNVNQLIEDSAPEEVKAFMEEHMTSENMNKTFRKEHILGFGSFKRMSGVGGLILPINDAAAFEAFIQPMTKEMPNLEREENTGKNDAFTVLFIDEVAIGWNDKTALIIGAKSHAATELKDLTNLKKSESITTTDYYSSFFDTSKDMGLHITSTPLASVLNGLMQMGAGMELDLENNSLVYYTNFEDDHLYSSSKLVLNDDFKSLLGHEDWLGKGYNKTLLNALPKDPLLLAKLSIDPEAVLKHIESLEDHKALPVESRDEMKMGLEEFNKMLQKETDLTTQDLTQIFEGSMIMAMTEGKTVKDTVYSYNYFSDDADEYEIVDKKVPNIYGAIALKNKAKFDILFNKVREFDSSTKELAKDYYQLDGDVFMVLTENMLYLTNDMATAATVSTNGELANNLSGFEHKDNLSRSLYMYTNGNISELAADFASSASALYNPYGHYGSNGGVMDEFQEKSSELYGTYFGENHMMMDAKGTETFYHTKGDKNSLVQMINYMDDLSQLLNVDEEKEDDTQAEILIEETEDAIQ